MNRKLPFTLVCLAILAFACGPRGPSSEPASSDTVPQAARPPVAANPNAPLAPTLDVSTENGVRFAFRVTNAGSKRLELMFPTGRTHDVVVLDTLGREVWRWSEGRMFTQAVQSKVMRASDTMAFEEAWPDAAPGRYTAIATLASTNYPVEGRATFIVQ